MRPCCVSDCHDKTAQRYNIPSEKRIRDIWIQRINNSKLFGVEERSYLKNYTVCEKHFEAICKENKKLKKFALPTLHLPEYASEGIEENCFSFPSTKDYCYVTPKKLRDTPEKVTIKTTSIGDSPEIKVQSPKKVYEKRPFSAIAYTSRENITEDESVKQLAASLCPEPTPSTSGLQTKETLSHEQSKEANVFTQEITEPTTFVESLDHVPVSKDESSSNARTEKRSKPVQRFSKICRLCLSLNVTLIKIFSFSSKLKQSIADALINCASIHVNDNDEMPKYICKECYKQLLKTYQFRKQAALSEKILRRHLQRSHAERSVILPKNCLEKNSICSDKTDDKHTKNDGNTCTSQSSSEDNFAVIRNNTSKSNNNSHGKTTGLTHGTVTFKRPETKVNCKYDTLRTYSKKRKVDFVDSITIKDIKEIKKIDFYSSNTPIRNVKTENTDSAICCEETKLSLEHTKTPARKTITKPQMVSKANIQLHQCNVCKKCFLYPKTLKTHKLRHVTEKQRRLVRYVPVIKKIREKSPGGWINNNP